MLLQELASSSKLLRDFKEMYEYENRLKTFTNWPFAKNCKCTPENMAKAGFVRCPNANEPDVVKCFFCLIELKGWKPNDDPWEEHTKSHSCGFLSLSKNFDDLTVEEYYVLEMTRLRTFLVSVDQMILIFTVYHCILQEFLSLRLLSISKGWWCRARIGLALK
uniref:Baculoviral IAP repeat-containing protein 5.1 n=1 Tax=Anas zonorhyncha TaxID=75864 RepID=A0A8B9VM25_9AVES